MRTDGQMTKLIVAFRNFGNAPKKCFWNPYIYSMSERSAQRSVTHRVNIDYQNFRLPLHHKHELCNTARCLEAAFF